MGICMLGIDMMTELDKYLRDTQVNSNVDIDRIQYHIVSHTYQVVKNTAVCITRNQMQSCKVNNFLHRMSKIQKHTR